MNHTILEKGFVYSGFYKIELLKIEHDNFDKKSKTTCFRELMSGNDDVFLFLIDSIKKQGLYVHQFRVGAIENDSAWTTEVIAGLIDKGEKPIVSAIRECEEEASLIVNEDFIEHLLTAQPSIGGSLKKSHFFFADIDLSNVDCSKIQGHNTGEDIKLSLKSFDDISNRLDSGNVDTTQEFLILQALRIRGYI